jgi:hypothetical protein
MGFLGDPLAGSHLRRPESSVSWDEARQWFAQRNAAAKRLVLCAPTYQPAESLPSEPLLRTSILSFDEQLDFAIRQNCFVRPVVLLPGFDYVVPFAEHEWINFMLSIPTEFRRNQSLYKALLSSEFPREFALPTKNSHGLSLSANHLQQLARKLTGLTTWAITTLFQTSSGIRNPHQNYIDFSRALAVKGDLWGSCALLVEGFAERGLCAHVDLQKALRHRVFGLNGFAREICLVASVECAWRAGMLTPTPQHATHQSEMDLV